ncbi:hypothetical protein AMS68_007524 [Peltaster fructicola]|uniref:Ketoreductase (KR) domain-containing protein n=1 Tax=Peltaster fructicola TaxID=286661 RepID=A0A6H0Y4P7_9PEZI|nr:hypothetical protein AMS68_007524 [Peltaster fructicola]
MVNLQDVHTANKHLVTSRDLVCVSAGGTAGIGETTLRQLASTSGSEPNAKALRVYIITRKLDVAKALIADLKESCPKGDFIPVECSDLTLLTIVDRTCDEIMQLERQRVGDQAKIDLVILSQGFFDPFNPRKDTSEGLDPRVSLHFYSRMKIIYRLLPLLTARAPGDEPAQIISVYAGGHEQSGKMFADDLSLRDPKHWGFANARATIVHMKTMFFEHLANDHPGRLSLVHVYPGLVITPNFKTTMKPPNPLWFRALMWTMLPIAKMTINVPLPESGQRTLFLASARYPAYVDGQKEPRTTSNGLPIASSTNGVLGGGAYSCDAKDEINDVSKAFAKLRPAGFYDKVWDHVMDVFKTVEAGRVYQS